MRDLARAARLSGRPVPVPWPALAEYIRPRGQNLMLVLAAGGVGKSAFALEWAYRIGVPAVYVSLDTSLVDHGIRLVSKTTGMPIDQVSAGHDEDPEGWGARVGSQLLDLDSPLRFTDLANTAREVGEVVTAETEYWGDTPILTIVDNLQNLLEQEEGAAEYRRILRDLHRVAKEHDTLVMALHHLRRQPPKRRSDKDDDDLEDDPGAKPVHLDDALYEGDKEAQFVLGLWRPQWNRMHVGILKNRMGPASRAGSLWAPLYCDLKRMEISEIGQQRGAIAQGV